MEYPSGIWYPIYEYKLQDIEVTENVWTSYTHQHNGEEFRFTVTWNDKDFSPTHSDGVSYIFYADTGYFPDTYYNVYTLVTAEKIS